MIKQAIIPLAGLGTRLLPLTTVIPKELLPINGRPGIEYIIDECIEAGIKELIFVISKKKVKSVWHKIQPESRNFSFKKKSFWISGDFSVSRIFFLNKAVLYSVLLIFVRLGFI